MSKKANKSIVWFRSDLRTDDHEGLLRAAQSSALLPVMIIPDRWYKTTSYGFRKTGPHRARFLRETLQDLKDSLAGLGSDLLIVSGAPDRVLVDLVQRYGLAEIWYQDEPGTEEASEVAKTRAAVAEAGAHLRSYSGQTLYHQDDIPFPPNAIPDVYSDFRRAVEKKAAVRDLLPRPTSLPPLPAPIREIEAGAKGRVGLPTVLQLSGVSEQPPEQRAALEFRGGGGEAMARLNHYFWDQDRLRTYKKTRNGLLGADYSSKFSPWLANGSISPRTIYWEVKRYERERVKNDSTYWLVFELIWRDYFSFLCRTYPRKLFQLSGPRNRDVPWRDDRDVLDQWMTGTTGQPFIDANMRELAATGFMSNRGRQNVASFLARDLGLNWLMGAQWFESMLLDYDPASNYGNWTYNVGVGTDPREDRYFDPVRQAERYDRKGAYQRHWLEPARA